jgi:hypothetical protein
MKIIILTIGIILSGTLMAYDNKSLKEYFSNTQIGSSADYGVFKKKTDYVISVHGFDRDLEVCLEIISMLNQEKPDVYSCIPLNH